MMTRRPVRVCLVGPSLDILGGQAVQAQRLLAGLSESDQLIVSFLPVNPRLPGPLRALQRVKYVRTVATSIAYAASLVAAVRRNDVVHAFSASYWSYLLAPLPALVIARAMGRATVLNYRSGEAADHLEHWPRSVSTMRRFATCIAVPSGYLVKVFGEFGLPAISIANFVPIERLPYRQRDELRPLFLSNRNLEPLYNVQCTIRAFARVQKEFPDARLTVAGDGAEREQLVALVEQLGARNVSFIGRVSPDDMGELYNSADIYLNSPNIDNMPGSIIEAFACGIPVVSTNAGGIPFVVENEANGLLVACNDHDAMAAASIRLLREPAFARTLADAGRRRCEEQYVWPAVRRQWEQLYVSLAAQ
jgi:glycosyltransferase involved in cell wall biosynthesis